jgi:hypothetical protein
VRRPDELLGTADDLQHVAGQAWIVEQRTQQRRLDFGSLGRQGIGQPRERATIELDTLARGA